jgi:hypothetical protein
MKNKYFGGRRGRMSGETKPVRIGIRTNEI